MDLYCFYSPLLFSCRGSGLSLPVYYTIGQPRGITPTAGTDFN